MWSDLGSGWFGDFRVSLALPRIRKGWAPMRADFFVRRQRGELLASSWRLLAALIEVGG
jgi:hypothetical protein